MKSINKETHKEERLYCSYHNGSDFLGTIPASKCNDCSLFGNKDVESGNINYYYDNTMIENYFHVTELICRGIKYHTRGVDDMTEEQKKIYIENDYSCRDFCVFSTYLPNGEWYCKLHISHGDEGSPFVCYEGEYWEEIVEESKLQPIGRRED